MKQDLLKLAAELRKLAKVKEVKQMQKCAKLLIGATALIKLSNKIRGY